LNHPNIATIHGFEQAPAAAGQPAVSALLLELVEGQTLEEVIDAHRSSTGGVPVSEALGLARQVLDALDAAHRARRGTSRCETGQRQSAPTAW
jgi:serine/threonine protein kinase